MGADKAHNINKPTTINETGFRKLPSPFLANWGRDISNWCRGAVKRFLGDTGVRSVVKTGPMKPLKTFRAGSRENWRAWLAKNHESEREVWVVFPKKHTGEKC